MFIHLGGDVVISIKDIISIMDIESSNTSNNTREFLKTAEDEGFIKKYHRMNLSHLFYLKKKIKRSYIYRLFRRLLYSKELGL